jgi:hypothetical protein
LFRKIYKISSNKPYKEIWIKEMSVSGPVNLKKEKFPPFFFSSVCNENCKDASVTFYMPVFLPIT